MRNLARILFAATLAAGCGTDSNPAPANAFSLTLTSFPQTVTRPASTTTATFSLTTAVTSGVSQTVAFTVSGLPSGVTGSFSPQAISAGNTSTLTLTIDATAAAGSTTFTIAGTGASGAQTTTGIISVCVPGTVTMAVTQQASYSCASPAYKGNFSVTNNSCDTVNVTQLVLTGTTSDPCTASGASTYTIGATVAPGATVDVLPLTGAPYCCATSPCSATQPVCHEQYTYELTTSAGTLTAPAQEATIDLAGCEDGPDGGTPGFCPNVAAE